MRGLPRSLVLVGHDCAAWRLIRDVALFSHLARALLAQQGRPQGGRCGTGGSLWLGSCVASGFASVDADGPAHGASSQGYPAARNIVPARLRPWQGGLPLRSASRVSSISAAQSVGSALLLSLVFMSCSFRNWDGPFSRCENSGAVGVDLQRSASLVCHRMGGVGDLCRGPWALQGSVLSMWS